MKTRFHEVIVKVRFDKPITRGEATASFRDNIHGEFYPTCFDESGAETMTITSVRTNPRRKSP